MKNKRPSGKSATPFSDLPKRAEDALRDNEANLTALVENTKDRIWAVDADYRLIIRNPQFLQGVREELKRKISLGESVLMDSLPQAVQDEWRSYYDRALRGESFSVEKEMQFHKESAFIDYRFHPIRSAEGKIIGVTVSGRDITERKQAEEALRKSEEKYRGLTENINLGIYRNTVGPEGKFIEANPAIIEMHGYKSKEEFLAINVSDLYRNPEDRNKFNDKMFIEGFVRGEELRLKKKDGSLIIASVSAVAVKDKQGHVEYYDGIIEDITERKKVEEALRKSESNLRALP